MMTIDIIGDLWRPAQFDSEGNETAPAVNLPGFHVNTTEADMTPELEPYRVAPNPLSRVWAGDDPVNPQWTAPLRFADEDEARAVLGLE